MCKMKNAPSYNLHDITGDIMLLKTPQKAVMELFEFFLLVHRKKKKKTDLNEPFLQR